METFDNSELLEPLELYKTRLKDAFHDNASKYFDEMVKKSNIDVEKNQEFCRIYYKEKDIVDNLTKQNRKKKALFGLVIFGIIVLLLVGVGFLVETFANLGYISLPTWAKILIGIAGVGLGVGLIFVAIKLRKDIKSLEEQIAEHTAKMNKAKEDALKVLAPLYGLYEWNMAAGLMSNTTPLIQLDPVFDGNKYQYLHEKYGFNEYYGKDMSTIFVQSGSILGNPFVFEKNYCQDMRDHVYTGQLTISYQVYVSDDHGGHYETRTEVLTAQYTAPEPYYYLDTWLIYGNEAAPNLKFTRYPTGINEMNPNQIEKYIKNFDKKLDKMVKKNMTGDASFTRLHNEEFEALFNALDRDNETQFRLLFTPLGQKNMINLLRSKQDGLFGDDFIFKKRNRLNLIKTAHMQGSDSLDKNPMSLMHFDYKVGQKLFIDYCDKYLLDVFFDLAPLISIPVYQQHKTIEYIYEHMFDHNITQHEVECAANSHNIKLFMHPRTITNVILKSRFVKKDNDSKTDVCNITAYSFEGIERIAYVPVYGGDGRYHDVPVKWIEYLPLEKETPFIIQDTEKDLAGYKALYETGKFNDLINKFGANSATIYKKRFFSFVSKDEK